MSHKTHRQCCQINNHKTATQAPPNLSAYGSQVAQFLLSPIEITLTVIGSANCDTIFLARGTGVTISPSTLFSHSVRNTAHRSTVYNSYILCVVLVIIMEFHWLIGRVL